MGLFERKLKYKIIFVRKEYSTMFVVKLMSLKTPKPLVRIKEKTFSISYEIPAYSNILEKVYFIDFESGSQLKFDIIQRKLNPNELDLIVSNKIVKEIASGVLDDIKTKILYISIGAIIGGLLAAMIVMSVYQNKIDEMYNEMSTFDIGIIKSVKTFWKMRNL